MTFPPGEWSLLLVGDQWPDDEDLMALSHGKINRGNIKNGFSNFADMLRNAQTGPLAGQQGHTADDLRNAFSQGENQARRVAEKNGTKESAYATAYDSTLGLQHDLTSLAEDGNKQIKEIQDSKQPIETKVPQIVAAIHRYRALASLAAAKYGGNVLDAIQRVLDEEGTGQSARQFAQAHGVDTGHMFHQPEDERGLADQVRELLDKAPGSQTNIASNNLQTQTGEIPKLPFTPPGQVPGSLTTITSSNLKTDTVPPPGVQASVVAQGAPSNIVGANLKTPPQFVPGPAPPTPPSPPRMSGA